MDWLLSNEEKNIRHNTKKKSMTALNLNERKLKCHKT